ncbi:hypothetical protein K432DRAFT_391390 [Lepidopterella palustris CBS 459.81]|uniref:Aminotransferase class I/classII large domain-containing protein n=1 Tax=Lepidopterella palustris CBS 459.81 TaxID=1314670 RepID=A0A8E2EE26_9PEZI|nr:hypothetical protein K432DRAFT_391390 [Lepidopterella palustris CBS 459.81]
MPGLTDGDPGGGILLSRPSYVAFPEDFSWVANSHNPFGRRYSKDAIVTLTRFYNRYKIHMLAGEVYSPCTHDVPGRDIVLFVSVWSFDCSDYINPNYLHFQYGMGKDVTCGGLRMGLFPYSKQEIYASNELNNTIPLVWNGK